MARVLGVVRLSRETDASTSPERQREVVHRWCDANGHVLVGWAEDLGVSATVSPFDRPGLGPWLSAHPPESWDLVACWRLDRVTRRVLHLASLMEFLQKSSRTLVSVTEGFDMGTAFGRMLVQFLGVLAEGELEAIKERTKASHDHLVKNGRHRGGNVPWGYTPVQRDGGWFLEIDPEASKTIREVVSRIVDGDSVNSVVTWLNESKVPTSMDVQRIRSGKAAKGAEHRVGNLSKILRSRTLLGEWQEPIRGDDGMVVRRAEPILTEQEWKELQSALSGSRSGPTGKKGPRDSSPMLGIAYCGNCGRRSYRMRGRTAWYMRCSSKSIGGIHCGSKSVREDYLMSEVEAGFLAELADVPVQERVFVPGESHTAELRDVSEALDWHLSELQPGGVLAHPSTRERARETVRNLQQRHDELSAMPEAPDRWEARPTGETYGELWERLDWSERRKLLLDFRLLAVVYGPKSVFIPVNAWVDRAKASEWTEKDLDTYQARQRWTLLRHRQILPDGSEVQLSKEAVERIAGVR